MIFLSAAIAESYSPDIMPMILSYSHLSKDETSEVAVSNIESTLEEVKYI